jgi:putative transcriptional regulator
VKRDTKNTVENERLRRGLTQVELAELVQVTRQTIIAIERGDYTPSVALALRLAKVFKRNVEDIFTLS